MFLWLSLGSNGCQCVKCSGTLSYVKKKIRELLNYQMAPCDNVSKTYINRCQSTEPNKEANTETN